MCHLKQKNVKTKTCHRPGFKTSRIRTCGITIIRSGRILSTIKQNKFPERCFKLLLKFWQSSSVGFANILLTEDDIEFSTFLDAREGIGFIVANPIDVVLMDINMPEINGIDACEMITKKVRGVR